MIKIRIIILILILIISNNSINCQQIPGCPHIQIINQTEDVWYGKIQVQLEKKFVGIVIDLKFDGKTFALGNYLGHVFTRDNIEYRIQNDRFSYNPGKPLEIIFFAKYSPFAQVPYIEQLKINGKVYCPSSCAPIRIDREEIGRWDATITLSSIKIHPKSMNELKLVFDEKVQAVGNYFADVSSKDQREFIIKVRQNLPRIFKFFVKYNELYVIPSLEYIVVNGIPYCVSDSSSASISTSSTTLPTMSSLNDGLKQRKFKMASLDWLNLSLLNNLAANEPIDNSDIECGKRQILSTRIIGGHDTVAGEYPWHAAVYTDKSYKCGATLITSKTLVTAAHCMTEAYSTNLLPVNKFDVILGLQFLTTIQGHEILRKVSRFIKHPDFVRDPYLGNDIGLILVKEIQFSEYVLPICLRESFTIPMIDRKGTIVGFGEDENRYLNEKLSAVDLEVVSRRTCIAKNLYYASQSELSTYCAGNSLTAAVCAGDSGGAQIFRNNQKFYIEGLVSNTLKPDNTCDPTYYSVYTNVTYFVPWIKRHME